jgi:hypothetical protein
MTKPFIVIAGDSREMTDDEFAQYSKDQIDFAAQAKRLKDREEAKMALLEKLGITVDEARLLLS